MRDIMGAALWVAAWVLGMTLAAGVLIFVGVLVFQKLTS
jgi:hypothetical protein